MVATETWEWVFFGMPWQMAAVIAVVGVIALAVNAMGGDD